jgi:hypothetical protein
MSIGEMQAVYARLYVEHSFLERFCADPSSVLKEYSLTERECRALIDTDREGLREFAASLRAKTFGRFKQPFRLSMALDGKTTYKIYLRFYELRKILPNEPFFDATIDFGAFLEESLENATQVAPFAAELARFEALHYLARFGPRPTAGAAETEGASPQLTAGSVLRLRSGIRLERFSYDLVSLEKLLDAGERPAELPRSDSYVVFQSFREIGRGKKFQVTKPVFGILSRADGQRDLAAIAEEIGREMGTDVFSSVLSSANRLAGMGLVEEMR